MIPSRFVRRLASAGLVASLLLAACTSAPTTSQPAATSASAPTTAPAKPTTAPATTAPATTASPSAAAAPSPVASPASSPSAAASPSPAASQPVTLPKPEKTAIKVGRSLVEIDGLASKVAEDADLYKKYGIEKVEGSDFEGDAKVVQTLIAGQVDVAIISGGPSVTSQNTDVPLITVATYSDKVVDMLASRPEVKSGADLKGKTVAISSFGGDSHASVVLALKSLGLSDSDVVMTQVGGQAARIAALRAGSVAAAPVDELLEQDMKDQGLNVLVKLSETTLRLPRLGIVVTADFAKNNPNTVLAIVAANLDAMNLIHTQPDRAGEIFANWTQTNDRAEALATVKDSIDGYLNRTLVNREAAFENRREILASQDRSLASVDLKKAYTNEYLDKLKQLGLNDRLGIPQQ